MKHLILTLLLCSFVVLLASCQTEPTVDDIVAKTTEALGGTQKLAETTDHVSNWEFTMHQMPPGMPEGMEGPMTSPMKITYKRPDMLRFDTYGPDGNVVNSQCFDGTSAWTMQMGQKMDMEEEKAKEYANMAATWIDGFHNYTEKGLTLELLPNEMVDGKNYLVVQVTSDAGNPQKLYINPETYLVERQTGMMHDMADELIPMVMVFKDYEMIDGIMMSSHVAAMEENGTLVWEAKLKDAKCNVGVEDSAFMADMPEEEMSAK